MNLLPDNELLSYVRSVPALHGDYTMAKFKTNGPIYLVEKRYTTGFLKDVEVEFISAFLLPVGTIGQENIGRYRIINCRELK